MSLFKKTPRHKEEQIDVVTELTTGKSLKELAEEALSVATGNLSHAEFDVEETQHEYEKAKVELECARITRELKRKDFDSVAEILKV